MSNDKLLSVKNLTKIFRVGSLLFKKDLIAVNRVSFDIDKQEIFTLAGESGSGKSTFARMLLGLIKPTYGIILYKGVDITKIKSAKEKLWFTKEVQPIFQDPFETFSPLNRVETYLYDTAINYGIAKKRDEVYRIVVDKLNAVGLSLREIQGRYPHELSGGQLQRVSIARALITEASLLVADEPVSMIDASLRMSIVNLFKDLKEKFGLSVFYITHDLATAYYISDRIGVMLRGSIVELGPVEKVLNEPMHPYTQILKQSVPDPNPEKQWEEDIQLSAFDIREFTMTGCKFSARCPFVMDICKEKDPDNIDTNGRIVKCHLYR
ncbi:MAG: ABC transporter ATP-binding protein [bacterium]|nr:ABC transporter ATP-binding protein [bacterium]